MKQPLLLLSSVAGTRALQIPRGTLSIPGLSRFVAGLRSWMPFIAIAVCALFLRLYRMDGVITYYPDTYAQLRAVESLLSGNASYYYPPGVALFLAPVFAFLPHTLATMQGTILAAGMALILVAYVATLATTGDRRAALLFAAAVALGGIFAFYSRVALFEVINTLLIALSLFLAPFVMRRGSLVLVSYAFLVFITITVRYTNPIILPILFVASLDLGARGPSWRTFVDHLRSREVITVGLTVLALCLAYVGMTIDSLTRFTNPQAGSVIEFGHYLPRLGQYLQASLIGYGDVFNWPAGLASVAVLAMAAVGAHHFWRTNRGVLVPMVLLIIVWSPAHAVYLSFDSRRAMVPFFFVLMLAASGLSVTLGRLGHMRNGGQRYALAGALAVAVTLFAGLNLALHVNYLYPWPDRASDKVELAYDEVRAVLRTVDGPNSVLLSSQALAVDQANPGMTTYDLLLQSETYGINDDSIDRLLAYVQTQQANGKTVYYHYTQFEAKQPRLRQYELGFDAYFAALQREFPMRELMRSRTTEWAQRVYMVEPAETNQ